MPTKSLGEVISNVDGFVDYADDISNAAKKAGQSINANDVKAGLGTMENDDVVIDILKNLDPQVRSSLVADLKSAEGISAELVVKLNGLDDIGGATADVAESGKDLAGMNSLATRRTTKLTGDDAKKVDEYFSGLNDSDLDIEAATLANNWSTTGRLAFDKLPNKSQEILLKNSQSLRYQAKRSSGIADKLKGACKSAPVYCDIGKGLGGLGAAVGVGFALEAVYDEVMKELNNDEDIAACIATCYPNDWYDSKASGVGNKDYKDLDFKTIEGLRESTGNNDINQGNTPLCTASMTGESCATMCNTRCEDLNKTFLNKLASAAGGAAGAAAGAAGGAAGEGMGAFLDGIFGEGMGIPAAIGIVIFIIIIMVLATTM